MDEVISRTWWVLALQGLCALVFGILALLWPGITLLWLVVLFAAYSLIAGAATVVGAVNNRKSKEYWWLLLLLGLVSIAAGVISVLHPDLTALVLVLLMGANALVGGVLQIVIAVQLRKVIEGEWLMVAAGIVSITFGILVFLFPGAGALAMVWLISVYAIATGILLLAVALRVRARAKPASRKPPGEAVGQY
jgi:uncharacterized membrane protein HdeD (DUF308 family)